MPNTKNLNEYITEVNNFIQSANSEFAGAFSNFLDIDKFRRSREVVIENLSYLRKKVISIESDPFDL